MSRDASSILCLLFFFLGGRFSVAAGGTISPKSASASAVAGSGAHPADVAGKPSELVNETRRHASLRHDRLVRQPPCHFVLQLLNRTIGPSETPGESWAHKSVGGWAREELPPSVRQLR